LPLLLPALAASAVGSVLALLSSMQALSQRALFTAMTILMLLYLVAELSRLRRVHPHRWLINPVAMASFLTFGISFGITNVLFFLPPETIGAVGLVPEVTPAMVKLMWLVLMGAIAMWLGYWSPVASLLGGPRMQRRAARWIRGASKPRVLAVPLLSAVALAARLLQVRLGVFGYSSHYDQLIALGSITQYLSMLASLGILALVLASLTYFWQPGSARNRVWLIAVLLVEIAFGLLSGFKSQVALPFVIVGVCHYIRNGRVPKGWIAAFIVALVVAYAVIEPFRDVRRQEGATTETSITGIAGSMAAAQGQAPAPSQASVPSWMKILARSSLTRDGSLGIAYRDDHEELPEGSPRFLANMLMAPAYAWIPRIIWTEKPVGDLGLWYTRVVMKRNVLSATASGSFTYLYFAGGALAIVLFFLMLGVGHRMFFFLLSPAEKPAGALIFLAMLPTMASVPTSVDGMLVDIFRTLPLLIFLQMVLFRRASREPRSGVTLERTQWG
jgi:hypothetical protein